jgi:hypothetical protein
MLEQWAQLHSTPLVRQLGLEISNLCPTKTVIRAPNEVPLTMLGMIPVSVQVVGHQDKKSTQPLFITKELTKLFVSRTCLLELGCLPRS